MTVFDIQSELGHTRRLKAKDLKPTPWLISTEKGLATEEIEFTQVILSERGLMPLNPLTLNKNDNKSPNVVENLIDSIINTDFDPILDELPEWSILTPRLYPAARNLDKSLTYELNLFLDRLDTVELPKAFGLTFDPIHNQDDYLLELLKYKPSLVVVRYPNIEDESPRRVVDRLTHIRELVPPNIAIYVPGSGGIGYQTMMVALGIDLIDDLSAYRHAARKRGFVDHQIHYLPDYTMAELTEINLQALHNDFVNLIFQINRNGLWTKFDKDMHVHPHLASFRHLLAHEFLPKIDLEKFPKFAENNLPFIGEESLYHPDVLAYQNRVLDRYVEKSWVKVLVLLPCSARKPYRESHSHQKYEKSISVGAEEKRNLVAVWSLTSPLGVVPRDIETVYPAQNYDIPVTGNWTVEETKRTGTLLGKMLEKLDEDVHVIAHASADYRGMIEVAQTYRDIEISWVDDKSRSDEALNILSEKVQHAVVPHEAVDLGKKGAYIEARNTVQAITKYNHGPDVEVDFDYDTVRIIGRPPRPLAIQKDKQHWITWDKLGGDVRLHKRALQDICLDSINWILVTADKLRGSNLFGVGVGEASEKISPGDEVIFFNEDKSKLLGLGVATVSGKTMNQIKSGLVASIRKKIILDVKEI